MISPIEVLRPSKISFTKIINFNVLSSYSRCSCFFSPFWKPSAGPKWLQVRIPGYPLPCLDINLEDHLSKWLINHGDSKSPKTWGWTRPLPNGRFYGANTWGCDPQAPYIHWELTPPQDRSKEPSLKALAGQLWRTSTSKGFWENSMGEIHHQTNQQQRVVLVGQNKPTTKMDSHWFHQLLILGDFEYFFPTCQVRVVRFYLRSTPCLPPPPPPPGGDFKYLFIYLFSTLPGEMIEFDKYFSKLVETTN